MARCRLPHHPLENRHEIGRSAVGALFLLATCSGKPPGSAPSSGLSRSHAALGVGEPLTEVATWKLVALAVAGPFLALSAVGRL